MSSPPFGLLNEALLPLLVTGLRLGDYRHHLMEFMVSTVCMDDDVFDSVFKSMFPLHDPTSFLAGD